MIKSEDARPNAWIYVDIKISDIGGYVRQAKQVVGKDDPERAIGAGISNLDLGLRLRYEIRPELAPYVGVNWEQKFGGTADYAKDDGEPTSDLQLVLGVRAWF